MDHLKTVFTKKEQNMLRNINKNVTDRQSNTQTQPKASQPNDSRPKASQPNDSRPTPTKSKNTLKTIIDTIILNSTIQRAIGIYDIVKGYMEDINKSNRIPKNCYKKILEKLDGTLGIKKISELRRTIMEKLPPNPNIENILDTRYRINKIRNKQDRESVITYLSKS